MIIEKRKDVKDSKLAALVPLASKGRRIISQGLVQGWAGAGVGIGMWWLPLVEHKNKIQMRKFLQLKMKIKHH